MGDATTTATTEAQQRAPTPTTESGAPSATATDTLSATAPGSLSATAHGDGSSLQDKVVEALTSVFDPEIPVNIYELGLIYDVDVAEDGEVNITMTLTAPNCPVAGSLPGEVQDKIAAIAGVTKAQVNLVWEPAWTPERMSEAAKLELGWL